MMRLTPPPGARGGAGILGAIVALTGLTGIFGLLVGSVIPAARAAIVPPPFDAEFGFLLAGLSLAFLAGRHRRSAFVCAMLLTLIAALACLEFFARVVLGWDPAALGPLRGVTLALWRMPPPAVVAFFGLGILLLLSASSRWPQRASVAGLGASVLVALAGLVLVDRWIGLIDMHGAELLGELPAGVYLQFVLLGVATVLWATGEHDPARGAMAWWHPLALGICTILPLLGLWYGLRQQEFALVARTNRLAAAELAARCQTEVDGHVRAMLRQATRWSLRRPTQREWETNAQLYIGGHVSPTALAVVETTGVLRWRVKDGDLAPEDLRWVIEDDVRLRRAQGAPTRIEARFVGPARLGSGDIGFHVVVPLEESGRVAAYQVGSFDLQRFVDRLSPEMLDHYAIELLEGGRPAIRRGAAVTSTWPPAAVPLDIGPMRWTLRLFPRQGPNTALSWVFAAFAVVLSVLLAWLVRQGYEAYRRSRQFERILDASQVGLLLLDLEGRILQVNSTSCELFGYAPEELLDRTVEALVPEAVRDRHLGLRQAFTERSGSAMRGNIEVTAQRRDGSTFVADVGLSTVHLDRGRCVLAIVRDISERAEAQRELRLRTEELARSNRDLEQFAYIASHDLRAPLRAVDHLGQWLIEDLDEHMTDEQRQNGELLRQRVQRMDRLLTDLLDYARVTQVRRAAEPVDLDSLVHDAASMLEWPAAFEFRLAPGLPRIVTDRVALQLVFSNLLGNALKHHDRASGCIEVGARDRDRHVEFFVRDDGPGIPPQYQAKAFEMFQTLRPRDEVEGSGMGLALVKRLVEFHGGTVQIESVGRGTTVRFTWPKTWKEPAHA